VRKYLNIRLGPKCDTSEYKSEEKGKDKKESLEDKNRELKKIDIIWAKKTGSI